MLQRPRATTVILVVGLVVACSSAPPLTPAPPTPASSPVSTPVTSPEPEPEPEPSESTHPATVPPTLTPTIPPAASPTPGLQLPPGGEWTVGTITSAEEVRFPGFYAVDAGALGFVVVGGRMVEFPDPLIGEFGVATAFHSRDGTTWQAVGLPTDSPLDRVEDVAVGDVAVAVGCNGCTSVRGDDPDMIGIAWTSADGVNWELQHAFGLGSLPSSVIAFEYGFLAVGTTGNSWDGGGPVASAVWTSVDGLAWDGPHEVCSDCRVAGVLEHEGQLLALVRIGEEPGLWASADGTDWMSLATDLPQGVNWLVESGTGLLGFGYVCRPINPNRPESPNVCEGVLATSEDGASWTRTGRGLLDRVTLSDAVLVNGVLVVVGDDEDGNLVVLSSTDGSNWSRSEDLSGTSAGPGIVRVTSYNNVVVVTTAEDGGSRLLATLLEP